MNKSKELVGGKKVPGSLGGGGGGAGREVFSKILSIYCCLCYHTSRDETLLLFNNFAVPVVWDIISLQELRVWALHFKLSNPEFCLRAPSLSPFRKCGRWAPMTCGMFCKYVLRELLFLGVWFLCLCVIVEVQKPLGQVQNLCRAFLFFNIIIRFFYSVTSFWQIKMDETRTP